MPRQRKEKRSGENADRQTSRQTNKEPDPHMITADALFAQV